MARRQRLREGNVEELRLLRELVTMDSLLIRKHGRLRVGGTGRRVHKGARERVQRNFFRNCFWDVSLSLFGEPECGYWPQPQIGLALWSLSTTGDRWQDAETLMRLSVLADDAVLRNPDWVAPVLFVLRLLRPLRWFGLVECLGGGARGMRRGRATASGARRRCSTSLCSSTPSWSGSGKPRYTDTSDDGYAAPVSMSSTPGNCQGRRHVAVSLLCGRRTRRRMPSPGRPCQRAVEATTGLAEAPGPEAKTEDRR